MLEMLYLDFKVRSAYNVVHIIPTIFADCPKSLKSVTLRSYGSRGFHVPYARVDPAIDDSFSTLFVAGSSDDRYPGNRIIPHLKIIQNMSAATFSAMMAVLQENTLETVKLTRYNSTEEGDVEEIKDEKVKRIESMDIVKLVPWTKTVITDEGTRVVVVPRTSPRKERKLSMRHFESLQRFEVNKCRRLDSILLQKVLFDCPHLEIFSALATQMRLEDVTEEAWASTGIQELSITINSSMIRIPVGSNNRSELDQQQKEKMERLEILYRQLGRLTELKILDTRRYVKHPAPHVNFRSVLSTSEYFLPGLFTVGDRCTEAGGLKNLTTFRGQFHANIATMPEFILGEKEITVNWSRLEKVEFYTEDYAVDSPDVSSSVEWLQTKLPHVEFLPFNY
ncbi:hypothetical protein EC957_008317 [Mortierella hygrophila]|uniref:Uncharacterized protein n=1 Tax=Mortierella hygrophila TaxID=979708 RepID=A0A9P6FCA8_9FUNG|nr:hypothetical protein EC957_008317 [Mortierella hygrophila]